MTIYFLHMQRGLNILSNIMVFNVSEDVFLLHTRDHKNPVIFGLFNTTRWEIYMASQKTSWNKGCQTPSPYMQLKILLTNELFSLSVLYKSPISLRSPVFAVVLWCLKPQSQSRSLFVFVWSASVLLCSMS